MKTKTLLAAVLLSLSMIAGSLAQTTTGTSSITGTSGTYMDASLSTLQRVTAANTVVSGSGAINGEAAYMLLARPILSLTQVNPTLADAILSDPTLSGRIDANQTSRLVRLAYLWKVETIANLDAQITYMANAKADTRLTLPLDSALVASAWGVLLTKKAQGQLDAHDYAGAIATATPALGQTQKHGEIKVIAAAKIGLIASDAVSWAKLCYVTCSYDDSQSGIDCVSKALLVTDGNLVRMNTFRQCQTSGAGANPLASVSLPGVPFVGPTAEAGALNQLVAGNATGAIATAMSGLDPSTLTLSPSAKVVAMCLRNKDGNMVRAEAFAAAMNAGTAYTISEIATH